MWHVTCFSSYHYNDVIMGTIASQITSLTIVFSTFYSDADQRKHQSSVSLAFVRGIHRGPVNSPHKWPVTRKMFPFDDVIMWGKLPTIQAAACWMTEGWVLGSSPTPMQQCWEHVLCIHSLSHIFTGLDFIPLVTKRPKTSLQSSISFLSTQGQQCVPRMTTPLSNQKINSPLLGPKDGNCNYFTSAHGWAYMG